MSKIDRLIRTSLKDTPKVNQAVNSRLAAKYDRFLKSSDKRGSHEKNYELSVRELEHYKRPISMRIGSAAAAVAIIAALGGSMAAFYNFRNGAPDDTLTDMTEAVTEQTTTSDMGLSAETSITEYDMSTKEGIFGKMINSVDYYDNVSGKLTTNYVDHQCTVVDFQCDINMGYSFSHSALYKVDDISVEEPDINNRLSESNDEYEYCDGINYYSIDNIRCYINNAEPLQGGRDNNPIDAEELRNSLLCTGENASQDIRIVRNGANSSMAVNCVTPAPVACQLLADFESWDITGELNYIGRNCIRIAGVDKSENETYSFGMYVDKDTGCLLYYAKYNENQFVDYMAVTQISFNQEAEPVRKIDLDQYIEVSENYYIADEAEGDAIQDFNVDYKTNSSGQTYGSDHEIGIYHENDKILPDLIRFKGGYVKKSDIFYIFGSEGQMAQYHREHNKTDNDELIYTLDLYDSEGNFIYKSLYFYGEQ